LNSKSVYARICLQKPSVLVSKMTTCGRVAHFPTEMKRTQIIVETVWAVRWQTKTPSVQGRKGHPFAVPPWFDVLVVALVCPPTRAFAITGEPGEACPLQCWSGSASQLPGDLRWGVLRGLAADDPFLYPLFMGYSGSPEPGPPTPPDHCF